MSYNVAIVLPPVPDDDAQAWKALDTLTAAQGARPAVLQELHDRLTARYPCLSALSGDDVDDGVWSDGPLIDDFGHRAAVIGIASAVDEVLPFVVQSANDLGLVVLDWATGRIHRPGGTARGASVGSTVVRAEPSMRMQDVRERLVAGLAPWLPGFRARKKDASFARRIPGGTQRIGIPIVDHAPEFAFSLVFTVRLEEVESIKHEVLQTPERYRAMTTTTATVLDHFFPGEREKRFTVTSPAEIDAAVRELGPHLRDRIVPFYDAHQDVRALDAVMSSPEARSFDRTNSPYVEMTTLALAHLAKNPRYDELVRTFDAASREWDPVNRDRLLAMVQRLGASR